MSVDWSPLRAAMARSRAAGVAVPIWWRDDDATEPTQALDQLQALAEKVGVPVHIAVIPEPATQALATQVHSTSFLIPMVHGWRHVSHAPQGEKNAEFGHSRADASTEIAAGLTRLHALFGAQLLPMFVPPWNRMDSVYLDALAAAGYRGLSTFSPRKAAQPHPKLVQINTHIDPIAWRSSRDLVDLDILIPQIAETLDARSAGTTDATEPLGLLTHHLVHTPAIWSFTARLLPELLDAGAVPHPLTPLSEFPT